MSYYNRFGNDYEQGMSEIEARRSALIEKIMQYKPENLEELVAANLEDDYSIPLEWVNVPDPRTGTEDRPEIEVLPVLSVEYFGDYGENLDITSLTLMGKLPSGIEQPLASMSTCAIRPSIEPYLYVYMDDIKPDFIRWDSADAELFLNVAEAAFAKQPVQ